jgi:hypothetical protein
MLAAGFLASAAPFPANSHTVFPAATVLARTPPVCGLSRHSDPWPERLTNFVLEFTDMTLNLEISLPRWIIEDGNYDDFCVGERRKFALEFWASTPLTRNAENVISLREQSGHSYDVAGRLVFASNGVSVIDCDVLAYSERESEIEGGCKVGDFVRGNLRFGVDPFFYFERHYKSPSIPPLIYEWQVNSIEQDTTPYILSNDARMYIRDESQRSHQAVRGTAKDLIIPDQSPEFILYCSKLGTQPSHKL